jgi:hypothetical protein
LYSPTLAATRWAASKISFWSSMWCVAYASGGGSSSSVKVMSSWSSHHAASSVLTCASVASVQYAHVLPSGEGTRAWRLVTHRDSPSPEA